MAEPVEVIMKWLSTLPPDALVGVDDGGLALRVVDDKDIYFEIGGIPLVEKWVAFYACPKCHVGWSKIQEEYEYEAEDCPDKCGALKIKPFSSSLLGED